MLVSDFIADNGFVRPRLEDTVSASYTWSADKLKAILTTELQKFMAEHPETRVQAGYGRSAIPEAILAEADEMPVDAMYLPLVAHLVIAGALEEQSKNERNLQLANYHRDQVVNYFKGT